MSNPQTFKHLPVSPILRQRIPQTFLDILASSTCCSIFFPSHTSFFMVIVLTVPIYLSIHHAYGPLCWSIPWLLFPYLTVSTAFSWGLPTTISPTFCASLVTFSSPHSLQSLCFLYLTCRCAPWTCNSIPRSFCRLFSGPVLGLTVSGVSSLCFLGLKFQTCLTPVLLSSNRRSWGSLKLWPESPAFCSLFCPAPTPEDCCLGQRF